MRQQERERQVWRQWSCTFIDKSSREENCMQGMVWRSPVCGVATHQGTQGVRRCVIVGLNPSVWCPVSRIPAGCKLSPTVRSAILVAARLGCHELVLVNLFTWCTPRPWDLSSHQLSNGLVTDHWHSISGLCASAHRVVCAWGMHGRVGHQGDKLRHYLLTDNTRLLCLGQCVNSEPYHVTSWQRHSSRVRLRLLGYPIRTQECTS